MSSNTLDDYRLKQKVISLIRTFRSLGLVSDSDVRINNLQKKENTYEIKGEYRYKPIMATDVSEQGTFSITLDESALSPVNVEITPKLKVN